MIYILDVNSSLCPGEQKGSSLVGNGFNDHAIACSF